MHAYPHKHACNIKQTQAHMMLQANAYIRKTSTVTMGQMKRLNTFPTMLKLISGTLVGNVNYSDLYIDSDEDEDTSLTSSFVNKNDKEHGKKKRNLKY